MDFESQVGMPRVKETVINLMKLSLPNVDSTKAKVAGSLVALIAFGGSISYATIRVYKATQVRLPANTACIQLADQVKNALEGSQNQISAVLDDKPKPSVDLSAIKTSYKDCKDTESKYEVQVAR